jgi:hypothetical protein
MGAVVIHDFEVLREAQPLPAGPAAGKDGVAPAEPPEPNDVKHVLQTLQTQALRVWAH